MDVRKIKKLIELVEESGINELEVRDGDQAIRIARTYSGAEPAVAAALAPPVATAVPAATEATTPPPKKGGFLVTAPLAGTFYRAPAPGESPFVAAGAEVDVGDVLCIIESMKMMNQIEAERRGRVSEILVADGEPIEAGQPLFRLS